MKTSCLALLIVLVIATTGVASAQSRDDIASKKQTRTDIDTREKNLDVMRRLFRAVEQHDDEGVADLYQPDVEFDWPPSLPYGGSFRGPRTGGPTWGETWAPVQPTEAERRMDPRVVAASDAEIVVLWQQRGVSQTGERFDGEVLGLYGFRDGKLARAQMFYFDTTAVNDFLARAITPELRQESQAVFAELKKLPRERQLAVRQAYWKLQAMAPEQWHRELNSGKIAIGFSADERALINQWLSVNPNQNNRFGSTNRH